jgi:hypothetical protein
MTSPTPHCDSFKLSYKLLLIILKRQNSSRVSSFVNHRNGAKTMMRIIPSLSLLLSPTHRKHEEKRETPKELLGCDVQH